MARWGLPVGARTRKGAALAAGVIAVAGLTAGCGGDSETPSASTRVERSTVSSKVAASGALVAVTSQNLAFAQSEQLKEVLVEVGDRVERGQVLARLDDFSFRQALAEREGTLRQQQALLAKVINGTTVEGAQDALDQAQRILEATQASVSSADDRAERATDRARKQYEFDQRTAEQADAAYRARQCDQPRLGSTSGLNRLGGLGGSGAAGTPQDPTDPCPELAQARTTARRQALVSKTALTDAQQAEQTTEDDGRLQVENARQGVVTARNTYESADADRPSDIDAQRGVVAQAAAQVEQARRDVQDTVLVAPMAGTVAAVNGAVGEYVGSGGGTTALAPGTTAPIPGVGAAATADQTNSNAGAPTATRPGGNAFIVLSNVNAFQVVVPFEESDAAKVTPNQHVEVSFDAIPDLTKAGTVLAVAPGGTSISGVTNYYATVLLNDGDPRLRSGLTAEVAVLTNEAKDVLVVPNSAVITRNGRTFVLTPGPDGQPVEVPFQAGVVGDQGTQVVSGLREGQEILTPPAPRPPQR